MGTRGRPRRLISSQNRKPPGSLLEGARVEGRGVGGTQGQGKELLTAAAFISMIVPMIVFFSLQRFFVRGLTSGAVKG